MPLYVILILNFIGMFAVANVKPGREPERRSG